MTTRVKIESRSSINNDATSKNTYKLKAILNKQTKTTKMDVVRDGSIMPETSRQTKENNGTIDFRMSPLVHLSVGQLLYALTCLEQRAVEWYGSGVNNGRGYLLLQMCMLWLALDAAIRLCNGHGTCPPSAARGFTSWESLP
eukprot:6475823-Amphidinium_carterae.1